jgi:hypothetical protein
MLPLVDRPVALIGIAERGFFNFKLTYALSLSLSLPLLTCCSVYGTEGHSSMPSGDNAPILLGQALTVLQAYPMPADTTVPRGVRGVVVVV